MRPEFAERERRTIPFFPRHIVKLNGQPVRKRSLVHTLKPRPAPRSGHALAYDGKRHRLALFGGATEQKPLGDTWEWNGDGWHECAGEGPSARAGMGLVYDAARGVTVLFGGGGREKPHGDTWEWDGRRWARPPVEGDPPPRTEHALAYDAIRKRVVLFGGRGPHEAMGGRFGDTWEYDGRAWARAAEGGPSPRGAAAMTYHAARNCVLLFGGYSTQGYMWDTWEWNGKEWKQVAKQTDKHLARFGAGLAHDESRQRTVLVAGFVEHRPLEWDGEAWQKVPAGELPYQAGAPSYLSNAAVYDSRRKRVLLVLGEPRPAVWCWDGKRWDKLSA